MTLGVIMLDTRFTRFPGDIGHAESHPDPVLFERVPRATASRVVGGVASLSDPAERALAVAPFIAAGERLIARGAHAITISCGFLVAYQAELAAALSVPVLTSALCLLPDIAGALAPGSSIGVLTFDAAALGPMHLAAAGYSGDCAVVGLDPDAVFRRAVLERPTNDSFAARDADVADAARRLGTQALLLGAVVLECTNFPPHRAAIEAVMPGVPVFDIWSIVHRLAAMADAAPRP